MSGVHTCNHLNNLMRLRLICSFSVCIHWEYQGSFQMGLNIPYLHPFTEVDGLFAFRWSPTLSHSTAQGAAGKSSPALPAIDAMFACWRVDIKGIDQVIGSPQTGIVACYMFVLLGLSANGDMVWYTPKMQIIGKSGPPGKSSMNPF
jgi:hypothetical protein